MPLISGMHNPQWAELVPLLEQLGIEVSTAEEFAFCEKEAADLVARKASKPPTRDERPTRQFGIEEQHPNVAKCENGYGWIDIGIHDWEGLQVRALDEGGPICENTIASR